MPKPQRERREKPKAKITDADLRGMIEVSGLDPTQRGTLAMVADALFRHDLTITASFHRIASLCGVGRSAAINRMRSLERMGVIVKTRGGGGRFENGRGRVNIWRLDLDALRATRPPPFSNGGNGPCPPFAMGVVSETLNGSAEHGEGCSEASATVQPAAHDPSIPSLPRKNPSAGGSCGETDPPPPIDRPAQNRAPRAIPPGLRPWVKRFDHPEQTRADRLAQLRAQAAFDKQRTNTGSTDTKPSVDSDQKGGA